MAILKVEAFSGLSGDMFLGALADLTGLHEEIVNLPNMLGLENVEVRVTEVEKAGIACKHIKILDHNTYEEHSHSHGHGHDHSHDHSHHHHAHDHDHKHDHSHDGGHSHHHSHHRHLKDIEKIIDNGKIPDGAKNVAKQIFLILGKAESKVHGVDINTIHFHEVGAIDSILDIVGAAYLLDKLDITKTYSTAICTGHGFVMADHGRMPIPAPATKELLLGIPTYAGKEKGEMTTPTGAAILQYLNPEFELPVLVENKIGHGPGEKDFPHPNVLRLSLCVSDPTAKEEIVMIETNIDDMTGELMGMDFQDKLMESGAIDFFFTQVIMKKGRPGVQISVFSLKENLERVSDFLMENTSSIGVRHHSVHRSILKREKKIISTTLGELAVKVVQLPSGQERTTIEYESCRAIAEKLGRPVNEVFSTLTKEIQTTQ